MGSLSDAKQDGCYIGRYQAVAGKWEIWVITEHSDDKFTLQAVPD